ncbi:MAG TPA: glycosyltransferase family 4 protein [Rhizomicrobium sp.]|jgi:glycosyltransferase involved in cell wall biosynthesis
MRYNNVFAATLKLHFWDQVMGRITAVCVGSFPPPVQGASVINQNLHSRLLAQGIAAQAIDLSPGGARGWSYHITRTLRTLQGVFRILLTPGRRRYLMSIDGGGGLIYNILLAAAMCMRRQPRLFYYHSTSYLRSENRLMRLLLKIAGDRTLHVACTARMLSQLGALYGVKVSGLVVNNAAWVDIPPVSGTPTREVLRLGLLSGLTTEKGPERAVQTLRELRRRGVNAELALAGAIQDSATQALLDDAAREFGPAVQYAGIITGAAKTSFYAGLDYFLFPSLYRHETQSLVVPEALAAGIPVIAYDHEFVGEVVGAGGYLIPANEDFADRAADWILAGDAAARRGMARAQIGNLRVQAEGQIDKILDWAQGLT